MKYKPLSPPKMMGARVFKMIWIGRNSVSMNLQQIFRMATSKWSQKTMSNGLKHCRKMVEYWLNEDWMMVESWLTNLSQNGGKSKFGWVTAFPRWRLQRKAKSSRPHHSQQWTEECPSLASNAPCVFRLPVDIIIDDPENRFGSPFWRGTNTCQIHPKSVDFYQQNTVQKFLVKLQGSTIWHTQWLNRLATGRKKPFGHWWRPTSKNSSRLSAASNRGATTLA